MPDSYDRFQDVEDPDHPKPLLEQRKKARDHKVFMRFLALSPRAEAYYLKLEERRLNPHHHVRKIVALSDIYTPEAVARAMEDAFVYEAFSSDYIANLVEQRARFTPEASALHLTRRDDLLDVSLAPPDLSIYHATPQPEATRHRGDRPSCLNTTTRRLPPEDASGDVEHHLTYLKLSFMAEQYARPGHTRGPESSGHTSTTWPDSLEGEADVRRDRATKSRIRLARFPVIKTLEQFRWDWPTRINRLQVQNHFRLGVYQGQSQPHLSGRCRPGKNASGDRAWAIPPASRATRCSLPVPLMSSTRWPRPRVPAVSKRNSKNTPNRRCSSSTNSAICPIDKTGADLLFQVISLRYEQGAIIITSNRAFKEWPKIFNNDSTLTSAILDRLLHHADTVIIEGKSFRMKDQIET